MNNNALEAGLFLDRLRSTTSQSHKNLENLPVSLSIISRDVTKEEYIRYLCLMHDVIKDAEQNIFPVLGNIIPDLEQRAKTKWLEDDLYELRNPKTGRATPLSSNAGLFSVAFALGIMYVVEGSTLGGRFILKNITENLGFDGEKGAKYFAGYGNATGSKWKTFLNAMVRFEEENKCEEEIIAGADFAFNQISNHFTCITQK